MGRYEDSWKRNLNSVINTLIYMRDNPYKDHDNYIKWLNTIWGWLPELKRAVIYLKNTKSPSPPPPLNDKIS